MQHDFRLYINGDIDPTPLFLYELDLFPVDRDTFRFSGKSMITRVCVGVKPVVDGLSGPVDAESFQAIANLRQ